MTQYRVGEPREAVESEDEQEQQDNLELLQAVTIWEDDLDEAKETAETKGKLSRERAWHLTRAYKTYEMARSCRLQRSA